MKAMPRGYFVYTDLNGNGTAMLYDTNIVKIANSTLILNTGGHNGPHTKKCMNLFIKPMGWKVYQEKFEWYITNGCLTVRFEDNKVEVGI